MRYFVKALDLLFAVPESEQYKQGLGVCVTGNEMMSFIIGRHLNSIMALQ